MATDWGATLGEQTKIARRMADHVSLALEHSDLTLEQASHLYQAVEGAARVFDRLVKRMYGQDLDASLYEKIETLEEIWSNLLITTDNRVRVIRGLAPIASSYDAGDTK